MRLIRVPSWPEPFDDIAFVETPGRCETPYGILSHTWNDGEEVSYADVIGQNYKHKKGWLKIKSVMRVAQADRFSSVWVDTCCIDKTSSAELSESINSMFKWYEAAAECYVYLEDNFERRGIGEDLINLTTSSNTCCRWFTRGWTLQELLAPHSVGFYSSAWQFLGHKKELSPVLSSITGVPEPYMLGLKDARSASISARMSWAANRKTTREEDLAYCLLGLFNINMPLLYGEGDKAFVRLQEEIMKGSDDQTIFAWAIDLISQPQSTRVGLLATSPDAFKNSGHFLPLEDIHQGPPYQMTNRGLQIQLRMSQLHDPNTGSTYYEAELECDPSAVITLHKMKARAEQYMRYNCAGLDPSFGRPHKRGDLQEIYVRQQSEHEREMNSRFFILKLALRNRPSTRVAVIASELHSASYHGATLLHDALQKRLDMSRHSGTALVDCNLEIERKPGPAVSLLFRKEHDKYESWESPSGSFVQLAELTIGIGDDGHSLLFMVRDLLHEAAFSKFENFHGKRLVHNDETDEHLLTWSSTNCHHIQVKLVASPHHVFECEVMFQKSLAESTNEDHGAGIGLDPFAIWKLEKYFEG